MQNDRPQKQHWQEQALSWSREILAQFLQELRPVAHPNLQAESDHVDAIMKSPAYICQNSESIEAVKKRIGAGDSESYLFIINEKEEFLGIVAMVKLFNAAPESKVETYLQAIPTILPNEPVVKAISLAIDAAAPVLAVTDESGRLTGAVSAGTLLHQVHEHYGDVLKRFTGILENSGQAVSAIEGQPVRRVVRRLPWLLIGTFGSMLATLVMAGFEEVMRRSVEVAFFIPGLVYLADAIGTQSEAIAVRGLTFSTASIKRLWWGELQTGVMIGLILAALVFPFIWIAFSFSLALAVALALVFASSVATSIGLLFPWLLARVGKDPAYGSGPIATIIQDLLSLVIYFICISWLVF